MLDVAQEIVQKFMIGRLVRVLLENGAVRSRNAVDSQLLQAGVVLLQVFRIDGEARGLGNKEAAALGAIEGNTSLHANLLHEVNKVVMQIFFR